MTISRQRTPLADFAPLAGAQFYSERYSQMRIFLSYASEKRQQAERLSISLRQDGHDVFFDRSSLPKGESYDSRIREALRQSGLFIFLISPESVNSGSYALSELQMCQDCFPDPSGHVLPVLVAATESDSIPNYLRAVTILEPVGNLVAEVTAKVSEIAISRRRRVIIKSALVLTSAGLLAITAIFFFSRPPAQQGPVQMKALKGFSMFAEPNQDSSIVRRVSADMEFEFFPEKSSANWAQVRLQDGQEGWVMDQDMSAAVSPVKKITMGRGFGFRGSFWQLFFTSPQPDENQRNKYGIDARFADAIGKCQSSLDVAVFELNNRMVTDAIIEAKTRGVSVRVVTDDMNLANPNYTFKELEATGIPIRTDENSSRLMHDKFAILDQKVVWTGSWNYTDGATYNNNENAIVLESPEIAAVYATKFMHMFEAGQFASSRRPAPTEAPASEPTRKELPYGVQVYFAPEDNILDVLQSALSDAKRSIRFMALAFTLDELAKILIAKAQSGVDVRGLLEKRMAKTLPGSVLTNSTRNFPVRLDTNPRLLHHDCVIIDDKLVITGSLNFTRVGVTGNDENLIVIPDSALAAKYNAEFERLWSVAESPER